MCGTMPKHNKSRRSGEGKSRPDTPPTRAADRAQKSSGAGTHTGARRESPLPRRFVRGNLLEPGQRGQSKCLHRQNCRLRPHAGACLVNSVQVRPSLHPCNPSGSLPTDLGARWSGVALWNVAAGNRWRAQSSRLCGWNGGEEPVPLVTLDHEEDNRAGPEAQAPVSNFLAEKGASPQCAGGHGYPRESRAFDVPSIRNRTKRGHGDHPLRAVCAIS